MGTCPHLGLLTHVPEGDAADTQGTSPRTPSPRVLNQAPNDT